MLPKSTFIERLNSVESNAEIPAGSSLGMFPPTSTFEPQATTSKNAQALPSQLKNTMEGESEESLDDVTVHYDSMKPQQIGAEAYAYGNQIHLGPGSEQHLQHEAMHVIQQKKGLVAGESSISGVPTNESSSLENQADNRVAGMMKSTNISASPQNPFIGQKPVIQAKKTGPFDLQKKLGAKFANYSEYKDLDVPSYQTFMYNKLEEIYNASLAKGTRYWDALQIARDSYADGDEAFLQALEEKQAGYDAKYKNNYKTKTKKRDFADKGDQSSKLLTAGSKGEGVEGQTNKYIGSDTPYVNHFNFNENSIDGAHNYADRDDARLADKENADTDGYASRGLPNSEIIWQQYKETSKKQFLINKEKKAAQLRKGLTSLNRRQVQPVTSWGTVLFALPNGMNDGTVSHSFANNTEEFKAMLGTQNCSGAAFMLKDHINELDGKNIRSIDLVGNAGDLNLDIKFT